MVSEPTMTSFLRFILMASQVGLNWSLDTMVNESLVTRARNNLMAKMMTNNAATHFMFIDADIRFQPESIFQMIACDKDVNWSTLKHSKDLFSCSVFVLNDTLNVF